MTVLLDGDTLSIRESFHLQKGLTDGGFAAFIFCVDRFIIKSIRYIIIKIEHMLNPLGINVC